MALLGLMWHGIDRKAKVSFPKDLIDYREREKPRRDPFPAVFHDAALTALLARYDLFTTKPPTELIEWKECFGAGFWRIARIRESEPCKALVFDFFRASLSASALREAACRIRNRVGEETVAVQLRVERNWQMYMNKLESEDRLSNGEEQLRTPKEIFAKIVATPEFEGRTRFFCCSDEDKLDEPPTLIASRMRDRFGIELLFSSDLGEPLPASGLMRTAVKFDLCAGLADYVGLTRSTFSNILCLCRAAQGLEGRDFIFNAAGPQVLQRCDMGVSVEPQWATAPSWPAYTYA